MPFELILSPSQGRDQCAKWITAGFLTVANASKKGRSYRLGERFEGGANLLILLGGHQTNLFTKSGRSYTLNEQ